MAKSGGLKIHSVSRFGSSNLPFRTKLEDDNMDDNWEKRIGNVVEKMLVMADQLNVLNDNFNIDMTIGEAIVDIWNAFEVALNGSEEYG